MTDNKTIGGITGLHWTTAKLANTSPMDFPKLNLLV